MAALGLTSAEARRRSRPSNPIVRWSLDLPIVQGRSAARVVATIVAWRSWVEVERGVERRRIPWLVGLEAGSDTLR